VVPEDKSPPSSRRLRTRWRRVWGADIDRAWADNDVEIITVVGAGMRRQPGVAARVFGALAEGEVNVIAIAQGTGDYCLSMVVNARDTEVAVSQIHKLVVLNGRENLPASSLPGANSAAGRQPAPQNASEREHLS